MWTLELMLKYFNEELQAKETCVPFKSTSNEKDKVKDKNRAGYTASCLHSESYESKSRKCVYCLENHSPSQCKRVTNRQSRIDILKKSYRCFLCLKSGHTLKTCSAKYICRKCNGKHHISICDKGENRNSHAPQNDGPNSIVAFVDQSKSILLQTAKADVFNTETKSSVKTRILFHTGSQRYYVNEKVRKYLNLKIIRTEKTLIKTFGQINDFKMHVLDVVQLKIKHQFEEKYSFVEALVVPVICSPLKNQNISTVKQNMEFISELDLADSEDDETTHESRVGVDYYFNFFLGKILKNSEGLVASSTVLGWVLSGPISLGNSPFTSVYFETHSMRCNVENMGEGAENLESVLNKFWSVENVEAKDNCVIHDFEKYIFHNGQKCVTKLPFRPGQEFLPDNFSVCEQRLIKLKNRLTSENLIEKYDEIFKEYEQNEIIEKVPFDEVPKKPGQVHYLPHRPVLREDKETTKIQAVFDASCALDGPSLNDCLYSGPDF